MRLGASYPPIKLPSLYLDNVTGKRIDLYPEGYWAASTKQALELTLAPVITEDTHEVAIVERNGWPLDVVPIIQAKAPNCHITVFETEADRVEALKESLADVEHPENVDFIVASQENDEGTFDSFTKPPKKPQDAVVLYHIKNHLPTDASNAILKRVTDDNWLKPQGHVALLGAHATNVLPTESGWFELRTINDRYGYAKLHSEEDYNERLREPQMREKEVLPTQTFSKYGITALFKTVGLGLKDWSVLHLSLTDGRKNSDGSFMLKAEQCMYEPPNDGGFHTIPNKNDIGSAVFFPAFEGKDFVAVGQKTASNPTLDFEA